MKIPTLFTIIVILLFPTKIFSQANDKLRSDNLLPDRFIPYSIPEEQIKHLTQSDVFKEGESRIIINKIILDNGFLLNEELWQEWDGSNWVNYGKLAYTYDGNNNLIEDLWKGWNGFNWEDEVKNTYTYDLNNNMIDMLEQNWNGSNWMNIEKNLYTYDVNNNWIEALRQNWDGSNWVNHLLWTYTYDGNNNRIEMLTQQWDGSNWVNLFKFTYTYDVNNNRIEWLEQNWDGSNWVNAYKRTYIYDGNNNMIESLVQNWNGSNWVNLGKTTYTYILTGIEQFEEGINTFSLSQNYPNPFNPSTKISWQSPLGSHQTLKIYDVLGNEVATLVDGYKPAGLYEIEWDANNYPSGIYFYKLQASDFIESKKMMLIK